MLTNYQNKLTNLSGNTNSEIEKVLEEDHKYRDGLVDGKYEGMIEGKKEIIINLLKNGVTIDTISKSSGLSISDIETLIDNE